VRDAGPGAAAGLALEELTPTLNDLVGHLSVGGGRTSSERHDLMLATLACHTLVRAGQTLTPIEQQALIDDLSGCEGPRTCPHGRLTVIVITKHQLERQFGRTAISRGNPHDRHTKRTVPNVSFGPWSLITVMSPSSAGDYAPRLNYNYRSTTHAWPVAAPGFVSEPPAKQSGWRNRERRVGLLDSNAPRPRPSDCSSAGSLW
jgi:hypothetical protein